MYNASEVLIEKFKKVYIAAGLDWTEEDDEEIKKLIHTLYYS